MLKKSLLVVLVLAAAAVGYYQYSIHQIQGELDAFALQLRPVATLDYGDVRLTPAGEVRVDTIRLQPRDGTRGLRAERAVLDAGGPVALARMRPTVGEPTLPETLTLRLEGIHIPLDAVAAAVAPDTAHPAMTLDVAGCGERAGLSRDDLEAMGYQDLTGTLAVQYELAPDRGELDAELAVHVESMSRLEANASLAFPPGTDTTEALGRAAMTGGITPGLITLTYHDAGYFPRMLAFCAEATDQSPEAYADTHHAAWLDALDDLGVEPGEVARTAYARFLEEPDRVTLQLTGLEQIGPLLHGAVEPLIERVDVRVLVNGDLLGVLDGALPGLADEPPTDETAATGSGRDDPQPPDTAAPDSDGTEAELPTLRYTPVAVKHLHGLDGRRVIARLHDGREWFGRLHSVEDDVIRIRQRMFGGYVVLPVRREDLAGIRVRR